MTRAAMLTDLKRSGLTAADGKKATYKPLNAKQVQDLTGNHAAGYLIPYYDVAGKKTDYWRVRYTEEVKGAFGASKKKPLRYTGPKNALPRFYFPKRVNWQKLNNDASEPLIITEGEKKAEKACKSGLPCFSVPGVWAWRSIKQGVAAIPDFDLIEWQERKVMLCFDNDLMVNPDVIQALNALAHELTSRGAIVVIKLLPKGPGKIGLDDYLKKRKVSAFLKLKEEEFSECAELWKLNERLAFVDTLGAVYDFDTRRFYRTKAELLFVFADATYLVKSETTDKNGNVKASFKEKNAAEDWLKWKQKRRYKDIVYMPGCEAVVDESINTWLGYGCEPKKGNVKPFHDLLNYLFKDEPELLAWFVQWLAYPLQNPGIKNLTAVLLHSTAQGVGKSFVGYIMSDIYGDNFNVVGQEDLQGAFNGWVVNKQFILGEEITGTNSRAQSDRLKNMVTREKLNVKIKYQPEYPIDDRANLLLTSNHVDALFLEETDRRAVIHDINYEANPFEFYERIDCWRENGGGAHVFYYLLNDVDLADFNPKRPAPTTAAKEAMIALSKSDVDLATQAICEQPNTILRNGKVVNVCAFLTTAQLQMYINNYTDGHSTLIAISKALRRAGFKQRPIGTDDGVKRLWCVRDYLSVWKYKAPQDWANEHNKYTKVKKF